eukprot:9349401-Prorocentrum_lima.AAC.1
MTSSLVGSEMCIRDSSGVLVPLFQSVLVVLVGRLLFLASCSSTGEAVSYTHLTLPTICSV